MGVPSENGILRTFAERKPESPAGNLLMVAIVSVEHGYQQKTAELDAAVDTRPVITSAHPLEESLAAFWAYLDSTRMPSVRNIPFSEATPRSSSRSASAG